MLKNILVAQEETFRRALWRKTSFVGKQKASLFLKMDSTKTSTRGRSKSREPGAEENVDSSVTPRNLRSKSLQTPATGRRNSLNPITTVLLSQPSPSTSDTEDSCNPELAKLPEQFSFFLKEQEQAQRKHEQYMMDMMDFSVKQEQMMDRLKEKLREREQQLEDQMMVIQDEIMKGNNACHEHIMNQIKEHLQGVVGDKKSSSSEAIRECLAFFQKNVRKFALAITFAVILFTV